MISLIKGTIESVGKDSLVVMTAGGVGYEVGFKISDFGFKIGEEVTLFTYLKVSDSGMSLYGFETVEEKVFFELLLGVSGVGPKSAMNILKLGSIADIQAAIARGDAKYLTAVQGMGKKTAERLCVELKSKVSGQMSDVQNTGDSQILSEVIDGLVAMGYSASQAREVVEQIDAVEKTTEEVLKIALQQIK